MSMMAIGVIILAVVALLTLTNTITQTNKLNKHIKIENVLATRVEILVNRTNDMTDKYQQTIESLITTHTQHISSMLQSHEEHIVELQGEVKRLNNRLVVAERLLQSKSSFRPLRAVK